MNGRNYMHLPGKLGGRSGDFPTYGRWLIAKVAFMLLCVQPR